MLVRSSNTPFVHFLSSSGSPPSSLQLRRAFSDSHLPSLNPPPSSSGVDHPSNKTTGLQTELSFSIYSTFNRAPPPPVQLEPHQEQELEQLDELHPELPLLLARGIGIDRLGSGLFTAGMDFYAGGDSMIGGVEEKAPEMALDAEYKKMLDEQPGNALFLRNYAQFLHEVKGDPRRAEEYYSRAMLADPNDGEIMSQYAKLVWEVHRDLERSLTYFQKSVQAEPQNSHVLAAYASFLWEQEDDDLGEGDQDQVTTVQGTELAHAAV